MTKPTLTTREDFLKFAQGLIQDTPTENPVVSARTIITERDAFDSVLQSNLQEPKKPELPIPGLR